MQTVGRRADRKGSMTRIPGSTVLITGGASGLGRRMAQGAALRGARLVLWDINQENLDRVLAELPTVAVGPHAGFLCDVSRREAVYELAERVRAEVGDIDILINCAGVVSGKPFLDLPDRKIEATFQINSLALFWTAKAFLPRMIERDHGHVVTIASASGYIGVAKLADYAASKWAAIGFDESLRMELKKKGARVRTTVVCPYYINTGMFAGVKTRFPRLLPILDERKVAERALRAIDRNKARLVMPRLVALVPSMRLLPVGAFDAIATFLGVNATMDEFVGRDSDRAVERPQTSNSGPSTRSL